jgi:hypothetical protein
MGACLSPVMSHQSSETKEARVAACFCKGVRWGSGDVLTACPVRHPTLESEECQVCSVCCTGARVLTT